MWEKHLKRRKAPCVEPGASTQASQEAQEGAEVSGQDRRLNQDPKLASQEPSPPGPRIPGINTPEPRGTMDPDVLALRDLPEEIQEDPSNPWVSDQYLVVS